MKYERPFEANLINRENRFIANIEIDGKTHRVHVPNTGRCQELFIKDAKVLINGAGENTTRKTKYSLVHVEKNGRWVNIDSQAPNQLVAEWLEGHPVLPEIGKVTGFKREVTVGDSRFDFMIQGENGSAMAEVKGVTLEHDGHSKFPDAPTLRGAKHVVSLGEMAASGETAFIIFAVQMQGIHSFSPNWEMDPKFSKALLEASRAGVHLLALDTEICDEEMNLKNPIPITVFPDLVMVPSQREDLDEVMEIYREASERMAQKKIPQWQDNYPNEESFLRDIEAGNSFVFYEDGEIVATAMVDTRGDRSYEDIYDGQWLNDRPYGVIHRIAVKQASCKNLQYGQRTMTEIFKYLMSQGVQNVRIDTHEKNRPMASLLEKFGFVKCGKVTVHDGTERVAYQKELFNE